MCGVKDIKTREKLLQEENLTLEKCVNICQVNEISATHVKALQTESEIDLAQQTHEINRVTSKAKYGSKTANRRETATRHSENGAKSVCDFCTYEHYTNRCPAKFEQCNSCHKVGHFSKSKICKARRNSRPKVVREINDSRSSDDEDRMQYDVAGVKMQDQTNQLEDLVIDYIAGNEPDDWIETCHIGRTAVNFKLDSGSQADVLPENCFKDTGLALLHSNASLQSYLGHKLLAVGKTIANLKVGNATHQVVFQTYCRATPP